MSISLGFDAEVLGVGILFNVPDRELAVCLLGFVIIVEFHS